MSRSYSKPHWLSWLQEKKIKPETCPLIAALFSDQGSYMTAVDKKYSEMWYFIAHLLKLFTSWCII